jgi:hypothetical protein
VKIFRNELDRRRVERRQKQSSTWGGFIVKLAIFILLVVLIRFIISEEGAGFGEYWRATFHRESRK